MLQRLLALATSCSLLLTCAAPVAFGQTQKEDAKRAARMKSIIDKVGTGRDARIEIRLRDQTELKGYVSEKKDDGFTLADAATGAGTHVMYSQVEKVKLTPQFIKGVLKREATGKRLAKNVALGAAAFIGLTLLVYAVAGDDR